MNWGCVVGDVFSNRYQDDDYCSRIASSQATIFSIFPYRLNNYKRINNQKMWMGLAMAMERQVIFRDYGPGEPFLFLRLQVSSSVLSSQLQVPILFLNWLLWPLLSILVWMQQIHSFTNGNRTKVPCLYDYFKPKSFSVSNLQMFDILASAQGRAGDHSPGWTQFLSFGSLKGH